jgi:uncharacterized protein (DUF952 family)
MASSTSSKAPSYVYKLVPSSAPILDPLPDALPISELDSTSGFIHLSTSIQISNTLKLFFGSHSSVYILRIPYSGQVEEKIRWEDPKAEVCGPRGGEGMFPHLYNELKLGKNEMDSVKLLEKASSDEGWDESLRKAEEEEWLIY